MRDIAARSHRTHAAPNSARKMKTLRASAILALALWSRALLAQAAPTPIYVTAHLAPECHGAGDFAQRLLARTHRLRWANPGEPGIVFDIAAQTFQGGFVGQLQIQEIDGRFTQRAVEGTTCDGVINALAFVAAVLVDPESAERIETQATAPQPLPPPPIAPTFNARKVFEWGIGVTLGATSATANSLLQPNIGGRLTLAWNSPGFSPWITAGYDQRFNSKVHTVFDNPNQTADTTFGGWAAHIALSPVRWPDTGHYFLRPAALLEIGQLTSNAKISGQNVAGRQSLVWLAPGLGVSAEARISRPVALVADLGIVFPAQHRDYYYTTPGGGEKSAFVVPDAGLSARLGLIVKFE